MSDWDASDDETTKKPAVVAPKPPVKATKWEGEDEDDSGPVVSLLSTVQPHASYSQTAHIYIHLGYARVTGRTPSPNQRNP